DAAAAMWIRRSAEAGYAPAEFIAGLIAEKGRGTTTDMAGAVQLYERAASGGVPEAEAALGDIYYRGTGTSRNCEKAMRFLRLAADHDVSYAQFLLAHLYEIGDCVTADPILAHSWYSSAWHHACVRDGSAALEWRNRLEQRMTADQIR